MEKVKLLYHWVFGLYRVYYYKNPFLESLLATGKMIGLNAEYREQKPRVVHTLDCQEDKPSQLTQGGVASSINMSNTIIIVVIIVILIIVIITIIVIMIIAIVIIIMI